MVAPCVSGDLHRASVSAIQALIDFPAAGQQTNDYEEFRRAGLAPNDDAWAVERALTEYLESVWQQPDNGIWEMRGPQRHFVHSKVMAWVAFDRAVRSIEKWQLAGPVERWKQIRGTLHAEICDRGFDRSLNSFVQYLNQNKAAVNDKPIYMHGEKDGIDVEIALQWNDGYSETVYTFANNINTHEGGTHLSGFRAALTRTINAYAGANGLAKDLKESISGDDIREGLIAIIRSLPTSAVWWETPSRSSRSTRPRQLRPGSARPSYTNPVYTCSSDAPARIILYALSAECTPPTPMIGIRPPTRR